MALAPGLTGEDAIYDKLLLTVTALLNSASVISQADTNWNSCDGEFVNKVHILQKHQLLYTVHLLYISFVNLLFS